MKRFSVILGAVALFASGAQALTIANLDDEPHRVVVEVTSNSKIVRLVNAGEVTQVVAGRGWAYLEGKAKMRVPFYTNDVLAIWNDGSLQLQMRRKGGRGDIF